MLLWFEQLWLVQDRDNASSEVMMVSSGLVQRASCLPSHDFYLYILLYIIYRSSNHSHKKQKDSLETRAILLENFMLC